MSYNIYDFYTKTDISKLLNSPPELWPQKFKDIMLLNFANELVSEWLENHSDEEYYNKIKQIALNHCGLE